MLVRVDCNVPLRDGVIEDDLRITSTLPTIEWLLERDAVVVLAGHLGRPKGRPDPQFSLAPVAARLQELLQAKVELAPGVVGPDVESVVASTPRGEVVMLENLRFHPGETDVRAGVLHQPLAAGRPLRERGVRGVAPGPRVDHGPATSAAARGGPVARTRGAGALTAARRPRRARSSPCSAARRWATSSASSTPCSTGATSCSSVARWRSRSCSRRTCRSAPRSCSPRWSRSAGACSERAACGSPPT